MTGAKLVPDLDLRSFVLKKPRGQCVLAVDGYVGRGIGSIETMIGRLTLLASTRAAGVRCPIGGWWLRETPFDQDSLENVRTVGGHAVDAQIDQTGHFLSLIASQSPGTYEEARVVCPGDQIGVDLSAARADRVCTQVERLGNEFVDGLSAGVE